MNGWEEADRAAMQAALSDAQSAADSGEVPVGAIVVSSGEIIGRGHNRSITDKDPSAHAEIVALRRAAAKAGNYRLPGATLYVTLEPCAMCVGAMIQARVSRVVFAAYDERSGAAGSVVDLCAVPEFNHRIEVNGGLLADEAGRLLKDFFEAQR